MRYALELPSRPSTISYVRASRTGSVAGGTGVVLARMIIAIFVVGIVGLLLEQMLLLVAKRFEYQG